MPGGVKKTGAVYEKTNLDFVCCGAVFCYMCFCGADAASVYQRRYRGRYRGRYGYMVYRRSSFDLILVGAYGPKTQSLQYGTLVASVPQGQTGSITVNGAPVLTTGTDTDILTNVAGLDGYATKSFAPDNFNNHYPFQSDVSDFVLFDAGSFSNSGPVHNYNAEDGIISDPSGSGQEKTFAVSISGFDYVHFDMYALETNLLGKSRLVSTWQINPGSHDSAFKRCPPVVPAPGHFCFRRLVQDLSAGSEVAKHCSLSCLANVLKLNGSGPETFRA